MQQSPEAGFSSYDRLYDFELQLFVQTFCNDVVREASREMQSDDVVATAQQGRDGEPPSPANCTVAGSRKDGGPGDVRFLDSALSDELSSGTPTPLASTTKRKSPLAVAAARRTLNRRSPTSADAVNVNQGGAAPEPSNIPRDVLSQSLLELSTIANAIVEYEPDVAHERRRTLVDRYWPLQGPFFLNPMEAKAFLQQSMTLGQREVFARQQLEDDIRRWWREFHRIAAPWHARAHEEHDEYNRLLFREINMRRDLEEQEDVARAVVRYLESSDVHGAEYTRRVFMLAESVSREELRQRQHLLSREIKVRAQYIAGRRMAFTLPPHRRATLIDYLEQLSSQLVNESSMDMTQAFSSMNSQSSADQHRLLRPSTAADGVTAFERLFPQNRTSTLFETESVRTSLRDVSAATRREARESLLSEQSHKRAEQIRASSASLQERLAVTRAKDAVTRRLTVAQERQEMQARRTMQAALREDSFAKLQQEVKIERLAYEWQSYEGKHPEVKDTFKSLLVGSDRYRDTMQGRTTTMSAATNDSQRRHSGEVDASMFAPRVSRRCSSATPSPGVSTTLSFLPKHQLPPAQKKLLHERTVLRTAAFDMKYHPHRARASVFLGKQQSSNTRQRPASAATVMLHDVSSIAHNTTLDESALEGGGGGLGTEGRTRTPSAFGQQLPHHYRSHTPPLQSEEAKLVESCEVLFSTMKSTSYHYVAPPPMLYSDDGSDATTGRNLFGDDVELHLLSPLERVLRWNLRAQQALRNEEFSIAEMHLKNAMSTLHTAEKDRRRAARRRSKQSSRHNAGADSAEEETLSEHLSAQPSLNVSGGVSGEDGDQEAGLLTQSKSGTHHHSSPATSLDSGFGFLSLQNVKMLTYTNRSFLYRAMGRYRDALQDLQAVLKVQQAQQSDIDTYVATLAPPAAIGRSGAAGRRSVLVVSPRSGEDTAMAKHMYENGLGITPDVLLGVSALLLQVDRRDESLHFARAAVDMLTKQAREDLQRLLAVASQDPSDRKLHGGGQTPSGAVPRSRSPESPRLGPSSSTSTQLQYRNLFINSVTALHNIAMTQSAIVVNGPEDAEERRVGKSSHAAALRLGRTVLGADHGVVVRVEAHARTIAQLLAQ